MRCLTVKTSVNDSRSDLLPMLSGYDLPLCI